MGYGHPFCLIFPPPFFCLLNYIIAYALVTTCTGKLLLRINNAVNLIIPPFEEEGVYRSHCVSCLSVCRSVGWLEAIFCPAYFHLMEFNSMFT